MVGMLVVFSVSSLSHPSAVVGSLPGVTLMVASMPKAYLMRVKRLHMSRVCLTNPITRLHRASRKRLEVLAQTKLSTVRMENPARHMSFSRRMHTSE